MSCLPYRALVSEELDSVLRQDEERLLRAHLALCRSCSELQADLTDMRLLLHSAPSFEPGPALEDELFARVRACDDGPLATPLRLLRHLLPRPGLIPSTALAGLLLLLLAGFLTDPGSPLHPPALAGPSLLEAGQLRDPGLLTVWDTHGDRIVATVDPDADASDELVTRASLEAAGSSSLALGTVVQVRIVLFQRIVVRG